MFHSYQADTDQLNFQPTQCSSLEQVAAASVGSVSADEFDLTQREGETAQDLQ